MPSLINDPSIAKYRQQEIEEGAKIAEELLRGGHDPQYIKGAMEMLKKLLQLPNKWSKGKSKETQEAARNMIKRDLKEFTAKYMKLFLE